MDHLQNKKSEGTLVIHATSGSEAIPVEGATVIVRLSGAEDIGNVLHILSTDESGLTQPIHIETPSPAESLSPGGSKPYTEITAEVSDPRYYSTVITGIPVYPGITSIQPIRMIPRPGRENGLRFPDQTQILRESSSLPSL